MSVSVVWIMSDISVGLQIL